MRWMITGSAGMLGTDAVEVLRAAGEDVVAHTRATLDLADADAVRRATVGVDVVWNCAAYTAVDEAEAHEADAFATNAAAVAVLARAADCAGARLVQVSTDYVFDGAATAPYAEDAVVAPRSAYGRSKAAGEWAARAGCANTLIVRTAWLYGEHGGCFPRTIARLAAERPALDVVADQHGQPTWTRDLADAVVALVRAHAPSGTYHATSSGETTWFEFARAVVESAGGDSDVVRPTTTEAFPRPAPRPAYSVLGHDGLAAVGVAPIGDWRERWAAASAKVLAGLQQA